MKRIIHGLKALKMQQEPTTQKVGKKNVQKVNVQEARKNKRVTEKYNLQPKRKAKTGTQNSTTSPARC